MRMESSRYQPRIKYLGPTIRTLTLLALSMVDASAQSGGNWTSQRPQALPPAQSGNAMAYDAARGQVVLFVGSSFDRLHDTWVWDGATWVQKFPVTSPSARDRYGIAYDSMHGQIVLFGGFDATGFRADTWVWDGVNWTQKSPQTSPPARYQHSLAYDSATGQVLLFGGAGPRNYLNDTWLWDGANWTQKSPASSPSARARFALANGSGGLGQIVLFGGSEITSMLLNDTWTWDGATWTRKSPQVSPPARIDHAMAYDSIHRETILFGGLGVGSGASVLNDTWGWDGASWTKKTPATSPPARDGHSLAYDSARGQIVLAGGGGLRDTWTWNGGSAGLLPIVTAVINASGFGGSSSVAPGSWIEIYGFNLASSTRGWTGEDFMANTAPTSLDGVQVAIGGQNAFVNFISSNPGQVNVELPSNIATGAAVPLTVTTPNGTSAPFNVVVKGTEAGLLAPASFQIGGKQYLVALLSEGATYILPPNSIPGVTSRQAHPGETITSYGIGFGPVIPNIPAGQIVAVSNQLASPLQILFGQTPAQVPYAGLAPGFVGLYQFNIVVPAVPDNDLVPVTFNLAGVAGSQTLYTAVHQ